MTRVIAPLQRVKIVNFRGIREMSLDLHPQTTVLFGANAAGKTSILAALAIGLSAVVARVPDVVGREFGRGDIRVPRRPSSDRDEKPGIPRPDARLELVAQGGLCWEVQHFRSPQDQEKFGRASGLDALHAVIDPLVTQAIELDESSASEVPPGDGDPVDAAAQPVSDGLDVAGESVPLPPPLPLVAAYGTERAVVEVPLRERDFEKEFPRLTALVDSLNANTRFKTVFEWFRAMEDEERREGQRRRDFDYRLPELEWVRRAVGQAGLRCKNPRVKTRPLRMMVDFDRGDGVFEALDIMSLSDGYRTHFALVIDVARRMVQLNPSDDLDDPIRGTHSEAVILIDEIDLHLDPTWQATVVQGLERTFPNAQFVLTTHSEQVIGSVEVSKVRKLVVRDGEVEVEGVPFAQGATGERILIDLMGAVERVPGPVTEKLNDYVELVDRGDGETEQAQTLRSELDQVLPEDPRLHQLDLEMQKRRLFAHLRGAKP